MKGDLILYGPCHEKYNSHVPCPGHHLTIRQIGEDDCGNVLLKIMEVGVEVWWRSMDDARAYYLSKERDLRALAPRVSEHLTRDGRKINRIY